MNLVSSLISKSNIGLTENLKLLVGTKLLDLFIKVFI